MVETWGRFLTVDPHIAWNLDDNPLKSSESRSFHPLLRRLITSAAISETGGIQKAAAAAV